MVRLEPDVELAKLYASVERYYAGKVSKHGATPLGVDWSCVPTQELRFIELLKLCSFFDRCSLNDVGCGYGALLTYLGKRYPNADVDYLGIDLSSAMIRRAKRLWRHHRGARFIVGNLSPRVADYSIASGIFNVKLDQPLDRWEHFVAKTLTDMQATSRRGFAVNFKAPQVAGRFCESGLYRTSPKQWARYCAQVLGSSVEVTTGYGLREFTLLVRK
jgi:SAM-dependent methyltransferase